jgi:hypothetical protein
MSVGRWRRCGKVEFLGFPQRSRGIRPCGRCCQPGMKISWSGRPTEGLEQTAEGFVADDLSACDRPWSDGHIADALMRALGVVMADVDFDDAAQMCFVEEDDVVEAFILDGPVPSFNEGVHVRRPDAGLDQLLPEYGFGCGPVLAVTVEDHVRWT